MAALQAWVYWNEQQAAACVAFRGTEQGKWRVSTSRARWRQSAAAARVPCCAAQLAPRLTSGSALPLGQQACRV